MTAVARSPIGVIRTDPELSAMMRAALLESIAVARAKGVPIPDSSLGEIQAATDALPPGAKSSLLQDLERGRPLELPWLSGAVTRIGREVGVPTPVHQFITTVLTPHVGGAARLR
jgi:2-dehydropantoate 2-reductase